MAVRPVLTLVEHEEALRERCEPVTQFDARVRQAIEDLLDSFGANAAYGIAAPQIGLLDRIIVVKLDDESEPFAVVNPEIVRAEGEIDDYDGCLSIPGIYATTRRAAEIELRGQDAEGQPLQMVLQEFAARVVQHEVDHLDGILFIDRLDSPNDLYHLQKQGEEYEAAPLPANVQQAVVARRRPLPPEALRWKRAPIRRLKRSR